MLRQAILINRNLKMGLGKICVQVGHAEVMYMKEIKERMNNDLITDMYYDYYRWCDSTPEDPIGMQKKVVLKSTEREIRDMYLRLKSLNIWCYLIYDKGLTQVPENSLTCLIVEPLEDSKYSELFRDFKLL